MGPPIETRGDGPIDTWSDTEGVACARGSIGPDAGWIEVFGVGRFSFSRHDGEVLAEPGGPAATVRDAFDRIVAPLVWQARGGQLLHASAVAHPAGVLGLCARSGTGKSTTALALASRGLELFSDDTLALDPSALVAVSLPFRPRPREDVANLLTPAPPRLAPAGERRRLAALVVLERPDGQATLESVRLSPEQALLALLPHGHFFSLRDLTERRRNTIAFLALADTVAVHRVRVPSGASHFARLLDALESLLRG